MVFKSLAGWKMCASTSMPPRWSASLRTLPLLLSLMQLGKSWLIKIAAVSTPLKA